MRKNSKKSALNNDFYRLRKNNLLKTIKVSSILKKQVKHQRRSSAMLTSSQKKGLVMIAVVVGLMALPMMY